MKIKIDQKQVRIQETAKNRKQKKEKRKKIQSKLQTERQQK